MIAAAIIVFGLAVWAGAMTFLYTIAVNDLRKVEDMLAAEQRRATNRTTMERYYQDKIANLVGRLRMAAPWMLGEGE